MQTGLGGVGFASRSGLLPRTTTVPDPLLISLKADYFSSVYIAISRTRTLVLGTELRQGLNAEDFEFFFRFMAWNPGNQRTGQTWPAL